MKKKEHQYQFTAVPVNLMCCLDNNCRSVLFTLLQLSSYYADENGWFFRSNGDLQAQSRLSDKMVRAVISTFHRIGILEVKSVGQSKGTFPNQFKLNISKFVEWEECSLEDCIKNPSFAITLDDYKQKGWKPSYLLSNSPCDGTKAVTEIFPSPHNIENAEIAANTENIANAENEEKKKENIDTYQGTLETDSKKQCNDESMERYWWNVNYLLSLLQHSHHWNEWENILTELDQWIVRAPTSEAAYEAKCKLAPILREEIAFYKRMYDGDTNTDEADDFYSQLREWKEYAREGLSGAFSYFGDE